LSILPVSLTEHTHRQMSWFSGGSSSSKSTSKSTLPADDQVEFYSSSLPPTLPVVRKTIDTLVDLAVKQRLFLAEHADKLKIELVKERLDPSLANGAWHLNGFSLSDEDAIDFVRSSPDSLSSLSYTNYKDTTSIWSKLTKWLNFDEKQTRTNGINVADDIAFALAVCEVVEVAGHVLAGVSYAMSSQQPKIGSPLKRQLAFELVSSRHRGRSHSMYLVADLQHAAQRTASSRTSATLKVDLCLYIYTPLYLGGLSGVAINVSGEKADDLPSADIDSDELLSVLAKRGTFVASAVSDFVLDSTLQVTSDRAATVTLVACNRLIKSANTALTTFFNDEYICNEAERSAKREEARIMAKQEALELEAERAKAEADAAAELQELKEQRQQQPGQQQFAQRYAQRYGGYS
jgi:hypothetical protein